MRLPNTVVSSASETRLRRRLVNSLTLVMTTLLAFIISNFATFLRADVSSYWLDRIVYVGLPLLLSA